MTEFDYLIKEIRKEMNDLADALATGGAADYESYRHMVGKIEGLAFSERIILDFAERLTKQ
jgi:hypothetical protein